MRDRRHILNGLDLDALARERAENRLAAGTHAADDDGRLLDANHQTLLAEKFAHFCRRIRRGLAGAGETERAGATRHDGIALLVRENCLSIVEGSVNMKNCLLQMTLRDLRHGAFLPSGVHASSALLDDAFFTHNYVFSSLRRPEVIVFLTLPRRVRELVFVR